MATMDIVGVDTVHDGMVFCTDPDSKVATCLTYINEFVHVFRKTKTSDAKFTYVVKDGHIVGEWTPAPLNYTTVGHVMCSVDNYLKTVLVELNAISAGMTVMDALSDKKKEDKMTLLGVFIQPKKVYCSQLKSGYCVDDVTFELKYWRKNASTGANVPFSKHELEFLQYYDNEYIPNMMRGFPDHPFNHLKKVVTAQYIAKHLVENTSYTVEESMIDKMPKSVTTPIHISPSSITTCVYGMYDKNMIVCAQHKYSKQWHLITKLSNGETKWEVKTHIGTPTGDTVTVTTETSMEGGVVLPGSGPLERRGWVSDTRKNDRPGMGFRFIVFKDDNKKCAELKTIFNATMYNSTRFDTDAETAGQLVIESFRNTHILKTIPSKIEKFCDPH